MMESAKISALLLISMLYLSSTTTVLSCGSCDVPHHRSHSGTRQAKTPILPPASLWPQAAPTCTPMDTVKVGACVDLLGGLVHIGLGDPVANKCCPVLAGLLQLEAAVCLCTALKLKLLDLNVYLPLALQLLVTCGKSPPPGYTCTL